MEYSICVDSVFNKQINNNLWKDLAKINKGIEFWSWWDRDLDIFQEARESYGIKILALCTPFVSLTDSEKRSEFIDGLRKTIDVCRLLNCHTIIAQVGNELPISRKKQHESIVEGLICCKSFLDGTDITLTIEPLNTEVDHKGYYLYNSTEGFEIIKEVNSLNIKLLYDIYHMQIMEGDILSHIKENLPLIGHIHIAGIQGRHEVFDNELDYLFIMHQLKKMGYRKSIGLEYFPTQDAIEGLKAFFERVDDL